MMDEAPAGRAGSNRVGNLKAMVKVVARLEATAVRPGADAIARKRRMVADLCRLLGDQINGSGNAASHHRKSIEAAIAELQLSPRVRQTLERLLAGDNEKQIAAHLGVSRHTVHCHVKALYRRLDVCSRGELLAYFIAPGDAHARQNGPS